MLTSSGFFEKDNRRGEQPEDWAAKKTSGDAVMMCQIYAQDGNGRLAARNAPGEKMKTFSDGVELVQLNVDPGDGQEQAKDNMRQYLYLMGKYGGVQEELREKYEKDFGKANPGMKNVYVYRPRKPMPYKTAYPAVGDRPVVHSFDNFALHHNISFEQLKLFWNFAMAYAKKTSDRKPIIEMMMNLYGIERGKATEWATRFIADGVSAGNEATETLFNRVTWRGWNLVEGPASDLRHDDPATRFDDFDVEAMPETRRARVKAVKALNAVVEQVASLMQRDGLVSNEVEIDLDKAKFDDRYRLLVESARATMNAIRPYQDEDFIAFNPMLWIYKARGREWRFEIRRP